MDSSSLPGRSCKPTSLKWATVVGTLIAILTLTIPPITITHYSADNSTENILR